jgi:Family of unknown function (DUF6788)
MWVMAESGSGGVPRIIRGSVVVQRRRCGKPSCRCAGGESMHESTVLSYSEGGRNRTVMLDPGEVVAVRAAVARYREALARMESEGNAGLAALLARRADARRGR